MPRSITVPRSIRRLCGFGPVGRAATTVAAATMLATTMLATTMLAAAAGAVPTRAGSAASTTPSPATTTTTTLPAGRSVTLALVTGRTDAATAQGMVHAAELAIRHATADQRLPGWRIELAVVGASQPNAAAKRAKKLASRGDVAALIGMVDDVTAARVVADSTTKTAALVLVGATDPILTRGADPALPRRANPTVFRLGPTSLVEGRAMADVAIDELHADSVVIVNDGQPGAARRVVDVADQLTSRHVAVLSSETFSGSGAAPDVIARIVALRPATVAFLGHASVGAMLAAQIRESLPASFVLSRESCAPDAPSATAVSPAAPIAGPTTTIAAGGSARPATIVERRCVTLDPATDHLAKAEAFAEDYAATDVSVPPGPYGAATYDAVQLVIDALHRGLPTGSGKNISNSRSAMVAALASTVMTGTLGPIRFDSFGDLLQPSLSVLRFDGAGWRANAVVRPAD